MTVGLVVATEVPELRGLVDALSPAATSWCTPLAGHDAPDTTDAALERWREDIADGDRVDSVVVAAWAPAGPAGAFEDLGDEQWGERFETAFAYWFAALGGAVRRCGDDGRVVAVVERPSPLDGAGRAVEAGIADAVEALVRSLARAEGERGVRVNAVSTPVRLVPETVVAPKPPLANFPGTVEREVAHAVEMLTGPGVDGVTGAMLHVDGGRSWR